MIKRQIQLTGVRKWWGSQLESLQDNIYNVFENLFLRYGTGQILIKTPVLDADNNVTTVGYVLMNGVDGFKVCEVSGSYTGNVGDVVYLKQAKETVENDTYTDSQSTKEISYKYIAADQGTTQPGSPYLKLTGAKIYDESGNELLIFTEWLKSMFYTKTQVYSKTEADSNVNNNIDASKLEAQTIAQIRSSTIVNESGGSAYSDNSGTDVTLTINASSLLRIAKFTNVARNELYINVGVATSGGAGAASIDLGLNTSDNLPSDVKIFGWVKTGSSYEPVWLKRIANTPTKVEIYKNDGTVFSDTTHEFWFTYTWVKP